MCRGCHFAREFIRDRRRHFASVLARAVRPRARDPIDVVALDVSDRPTRRREESSESFARARSGSIRPGGAA